MIWCQQIIQLTESEFCPCLSCLEAYFKKSCFSQNMLASGRENFSAFRLRHRLLAASSCKIKKCVCGRYGMYFVCIYFIIREAARSLDIWLQWHPYNWTVLCTIHCLVYQLSTSLHYSLCKYLIQFVYYPFTWHVICTWCKQTLICVFIFGCVLQTKYWNSIWPHESSH